MKHPHASFLGPAPETALVLHRVWALQKIAMDSPWHAKASAHISANTTDTSTLQVTNNAAIVRAGRIKHSPNDTSPLSLNNQTAGVVGLQTP